MAQEMAKQAMNEALQRFGLNSPNMMVTLGIFLFLVLVIIYVYANVKRASYNCSVMDSNTIQNVTTCYGVTAMDDISLKDLHIKTAYNCCCTGQFKNDYVDLCGLKNCAKYGVRALDFQIYSLNNAPVVSASSVTSQNYKEMYNSIKFSDAMKEVKRQFITDSTNCTNTDDPLFLIFRIYSSNSDIYTAMYSVLQELFGTGNASNLIYLPGAEKSLDNTTLKQIYRRVIIIVDKTGLTNYESNKLKSIVALNMGTTTNQIIRETEAVSNLSINPSFKNQADNYLTIVYPDLNGKNDNFDFVTSGINNGIQMIGLNFQRPDVYLDAYNSKYFNKKAFIKKNYS
jgi:hypothetical protein